MFVCATHASGFQQVVWVCWDVCQPQKKKLCSPVLPMVSEERVFATFKSFCSLDIFFPQAIKM